MSTKLTELTVAPCNDDFGSMIVGKAALLDDPASGFHFTIKAGLHRDISWFIGHLRELADHIEARAARLELEAKT